MNDSSRLSESTDNISAESTDAIHADPPDVDDEYDPSTVYTTEQPQFADESTNTSDIDDVESLDEQNPIAKTHDIIFVGAKPIMTYVNATLTLIRSTPVVTLKARGRRIKQAVDVALTIVKRMSAVGYSIRDIRISSSPLDSLDGKTRNISTIEIEIEKSDS